MSRNSRAAHNFDARAAGQTAGLRAAARMGRLGGDRG